MTEDSLLPFDLPAVQGKKVNADFEGGSISSDGGLVLLRATEPRLGLAEALIGSIRDWRDPDRAVHTPSAMLRAHIFAIACGYEDADDCDALREDPLFKLAVGRAQESGRDLCFQPTVSRLENAPSRIEVARMTAALVTRVSPKSRLGERLAYIARHWDGLRLFLDDGRVEMDNNSVENLAQPIALSRKNALFASDDEGAVTCARIASLIETARLTRVVPYVWLKATFEAIAAGHPNSSTDDLMPWNLKPPRS